MSVATTERQHEQLRSPDLFGIAVPETQDDFEIRARAAQFIGRIVSGHTVECDLEGDELKTEYGSLFDAIRAAGEGNVEARDMVRTNVRTDVTERTIKSGHVSKVTLQVDKEGRVYQYGQSMRSIQANSLRFGLAVNNWQMRERSKIEAINSFRIEHFNKQGLLHNHSFVVFSCVPDNMSQEEQKESGFFTDTMSCAIQVTTIKDGNLTTETGFVAGVKQSGGERYDAEAVVRVAKKLGVDLSGKTTTEILNTPLLVPNALIKNGTIDLVKLWDEEEGTFFGRSEQPQDYLRYLQKCQEREDMLQPKVDLITQELIDQAPYIRNEVEASQLLDTLSGKHMIEQAVFDESIDPHVFGDISAIAIYQARRAFEIGDNTTALAYIDHAKAHDDSKSCPGGPGKSKDSSTIESSESCTFVSKKCPKCGAKNVLTTVTATKIRGVCGCSARK